METRFKAQAPWHQNPTLLSRLTTVIKSGRHGDTSLGISAHAFSELCKASASFENLLFGPVLYSFMLTSVFL